MAEKHPITTNSSPPALGEPVETSPARERGRRRASEGRVLFIGANHATREHVTGLLTTRGFEVDSVDHELAALASARATRPEVILAEVTAHHPNRAALLAAVRADARFRDVPVIVLLPTADEEPRAAWLDAGADDVLVKPVAAADLHARVRVHTRVSRERSAASAALRAAEDRLVALVDQAPVAIAVLRGPEHRFAIANDFYCRMVARRDLIGKAVAEAFPERDMSAQIERLDAVYRTGVAVVLEEVASPVTRADGRVEDAYFSFACQPLRNARGDVDGIAIVAVEVTTQVNARQAAEQQRAELRRAMAELQAVLDVVPLGIGIASDPECRDIRVNPAFARQLGLPGDTNASKTGPDAGTLPFRVMQNGLEVPPDQLPMQRAARTGTTVSAEELDILHQDGSVTRLLEYAAPLRDETGRVRGAVGAFVDITDRARLAAAERAARAAAEDASRAKSEFLAVMSHELRTPLNAIAGYAELLALGVRGPVTDEQRADLDRIQRNQRHLLALINDILNLARVEAGQVRFDVVEVTIGSLLGSVESLIGPQLAAKGLSYRYVPGDDSVAVRADPERVSQVLANLLGNAVKFTDRGGTVTLSCEPAGDLVAVRVTDTGRGIASDKHEEIFAPFVQVGRGHSADEGTGLGLAISRDLARRMGGDLTVESVLGEGSTFTLWLPLASA